MYKLLSLNVRGLNSSRKRRQVFRSLHQQQSDTIFLSESYSSTESIRGWETEEGYKIVSSHGSSHSRGVMILFKPRLDADFGKFTARIISADAVFVPRLIGHLSLPVQRISFENKMAAMTRKRTNSSVEYGNLHSVVLLLLQQEYIFHPQEIKKLRSFGISRCPLCFASGS